MLATFVQTAAPPVIDDLARPRRDGKKPIVIPSDTETSNRQRTPPAKVSAQQRKIDSLLQEQKLLKADAKQATRDLASMTTKFEKSQKDMVTHLSHQTDLRNQMQADNKQLQDLIAKSHECLMTELGKVRAEIEVIRSTPVEIIATQQAPPPPEIPLHSVTRAITPQMMAPVNHSMHGAPLMSQSPTRDVVMQRQASPPFDHNSNRASMIMHGNHAAHWGSHGQRRKDFTEHNMDDQGTTLLL